ncbi:MAG: hypothetical protein KJO70_07720 [Gammaproteobacteria bacterium]|nr:hypothetical protein [Gammaproteobacteria bacterium]MBT8051070.1 hypothetical protein [Gammaproteobacteria bacterium]
MRNALKYLVIAWALLAVCGSLNAFSNPYRTAGPWAKLPDGREMGAVGDLAMDPDGQHLWVIIRCDASDPDRFGYECLDSDLDPVLKLADWGTTGYAMGEFRQPHAIAIHKRGRIFVADRQNNWIQIFDQEGAFIAQWTQFGRPSGIYFDAHDTIYVADSESDNVQNPGWKMGIRIGDALSGWVRHFIRLPAGHPRIQSGNGAEFVAVDREGNLYGGEPSTRKLQKYVRVHP